MTNALINVPQWNDEQTLIVDDFRWKSPDVKEFFGGNIWLIKDDGSEEAVRFSVDDWDKEGKAGLYRFLHQVYDKYFLPHYFRANRYGEFLYYSGMFVDKMKFFMTKGEFVEERIVEYPKVDKILVVKKDGSKKIRYGRRYVLRFKVKKLFKTLTIKKSIVSYLMQQPDIRQVFHVDENTIPKNLSDYQKAHCITHFGSKTVLMTDVVYKVRDFWDSNGVYLFKVKKDLPNVRLSYDQLTNEFGEHSPVLLHYGQMYQFGEDDFFSISHSYFGKSKIDKPRKHRWKICFYKSIKLFVSTEQLASANKFFEGKRKLLIELLTELFNQNPENNSFKTYGEFLDWKVKHLIQEADCGMTDKIIDAKSNELKGRQPDAKVCIDCGLVGDACKCDYCRVCGQLQQDCKCFEGDTK